jgi:hypothetical protein
MPFEQRATSRAVSLIDTLESPAQTKGRILAAVGGGLVTIVMWVVHLTHPEIFSTLSQDDSLGKLFLGFVLAPPFVLAFAIGSFIYRQGIEPVKHETGPMSGYFYRERANKRWKLFIVAGIITALNFLLMLITSGEWL